MKDTLSIPIAIIVAGILIAGAVFLTSGTSTNTPGDSPDGDTPSGEIDIRPVTEEDHILGNPDAQLVIVEYSDFECPFCKTFHGTMHRIIDEYGQDGQVAWVFRHFPLVQLHSKAPQEAAASECAAELGGNDAFWAYADRIFEVTPSNDGLDLDRLPAIAEEIGLDRAAFEDCLESGRHQDAVQEDYEDALAAGGTGTPYSVIVAKTGQRIPINGAQPYAKVKAVIDDLLQGTAN